MSFEGFQLNGKEHDILVRNNYGTIIIVVRVQKNDNIQRTNLP